MKRIILGDNAKALPSLPEKFARLVYIDPPFNTGKVQKRDRMRITTTDKGSRSGFGGRRYDVKRLESGSYDDSFDDFKGFLVPRIKMSLRCMTPDGSLFIHLDYREVHYIKVAVDKLLGRHRFMNEIIWAYDYGGRPKNRWPSKHDTILWYALDPDNYVFNFDEIGSDPLHGPRACRAGEGGAGEDPNRCVVAYDRPDEWAREDGLPYPEAARS